MTTLTRHFSLKQVATQAFKDRAIGAPLVVLAHVYVHSDRAFNAVAETYDPDNFPGTPPSARVLRTWEPGERSLETVLAALPAVVSEELYSLGVLTPTKVGSLPPARPDAAVRRELESRVRSGPFWVNLWNELHHNHSNLEYPTTNHWSLLHTIQFVEDIGLEPRSQVAALSSVLCHGAENCQDGAEEKFDLLCRDLPEFDRSLPLGMRTYLDQAIEAVRSRSPLAPVTFTRWDLLATLRDLGQTAQAQAAELAA